MVKVLFLQLFLKQHITECELEPIDTYVIDEHAFLVATREGSIQAYSVGEECVLLHQFLAVGQSILKICYVPQSDCILTLERKNDKSENQIVRAYFNWKVGVSGATLRHFQEDAFEKLGDFGIIHPPENSKKAESIQVFKFPTNQSCSAIAVCSSNGNVAIASGNSVSIFIVNQNQENESNFTSSPFICIAEIDTLWPSSMLSLCGDYVAFSSPKELQVLRLDIRKFSSKYPLRMHDPINAHIQDQPDIIDDTYFIECEYDDKGTLIPSQNYMTLNLPSLQSTNKNSEDSNEFELIGPVIVSDHGVQIVHTPHGDEDEDERLSDNLIETDMETLGFEDNEPLHDRYHLHKVVLILHKRFSGLELVNTITLRPEYTKSFDQRFGKNHESFIPPSEQTGSPLTLPESKPAHIRLFVSNQSNGKMYDLTNANLLCQYTYTNDSICVSLTENFLYVVTSMGLETWSVRNYLTEKLKSNITLPEHLEFPEPSLLGFQHFISLKQVISTESFVVLLSKYTYTDTASLRGTSIIQEKRDSIAHFGTPPVSNSEGISIPIKFAPSNSNSSPRNSSMRSRKLSFTTLSSLVSSDEIKPESKFKEESFYTQTLTNEEMTGSAKWSLSVLHPLPAKLLFEEIMKMSEDRDKSSIKFLLLMEGYFLLQTKLQSLEMSSDPQSQDYASHLSHSLNIQNNKQLYRFAAAKIGDYFMDCNLFELAAQFYINSDQNLSEIIAKFNVLQPWDPNDEDDVRSRARGLLLYLSHVLFSGEELEFIDETRELSNSILKNIYFQFAPGNIADVILDSCLNQYDEVVAVELLGGLKQQRIMAHALNSGSVQSTSLFVRPKESFALALLYLDLSKVSMAKQMLLEIEREYLVQLCTHYASLLHPQHDENEEKEEKSNTSEDGNVLVPSLGQLLKICTPSIFLEVLLRLRGTKFPIQTVIELIRFDPTQFQETISFEEEDNAMIMKIYLENLIEDYDPKTVEIPPHEIQNLVTELILMYLLSMKNLLSNIKTKFELEEQRNNLELKSNFNNFRERVIDFSRFRYSWLDTLEPFSTPEPSENNQSKQLSNSNSSPSSSLSQSPTKSIFPNENSRKLFLSKLYKVQNLLCSPFPCDSQKILTELNSITSELSDQTFVGLKSLEILLFPRAEILDEGLNKLLFARPKSSIVVEYSKLYCREIEQWKVVLDKLLLVRENTSKEGKDREIRKVCRESYSYLLDYLTTIYDPIAFVSLLPSNGSLSFFLPIIETSLQRYSARNISKSIKQDAFVLANKNNTLIRIPTTLQMSSL